MISLTKSSRVSSGTENMTLQITEYERALLIRALRDYKQKVIGYAEMSEEDKELLRELYRDLSKLTKKLS